jgi:hypothetical protein
VDFDLMRKQLAQAELAARDYAARSAAEARAQGRKREAISWEARMRRSEKAIALYGLERYAGIDQKPPG